MLVDESKGTGILPERWPVPPTDYSIGYAGGIGPDNIKFVLETIQEVVVPHDREDIWIDMETRLRSQKKKKKKNNATATANNGILLDDDDDDDDVFDDVFDLDKCYQVILAVCEKGLFSHPHFLLE